MLETTLSSTFIPGANQRGAVAGASWLFLLPSLPLERVICLEVPSRATLASLAKFSHEIAIIGPQPGGVEKSVASRDFDSSNIRWYTGQGELVHQLPGRSVDLVLAAGWRSQWRLMRSHWLQEELQRLLKPEGAVYFEQRFPVQLPANVYPTVFRITGCNRHATFWLTPIFGEVSAVVPLQDAKTVKFFLDGALYSPSPRVSVLLKRLVYAARQGMRLKGRQPSGSPLPAGRLRAKQASSSKQISRGVGSSVVQAFDRSSTAIEAAWLRRRLVRRSGILAGRAAADLANEPPRYLRDLAREAGVCLDGYAWGFIAPADYSSRKMRFLLFDRTAPAGEQAPRYIVKMVRDPIYNGRLENERQALAALNQLEGLDLTAVPQVVFAGYHANLALVGETVVPGVSFRENARAGSDDSHLRAALNWLTDLAGVTCDQSTTAERMAEVLEQLFVHYLQLYRLSPQQRAFMSEQLETIAATGSEIPLVFQHGDPGLWNLLITPSGGIAFLDWEAAESRGVPLWDLHYLMRSFCVSSAWSRGIRSSLAAYQQYLLTDNPLRRLTADFVRQYCERIHLPENLLQPLFYFCWMHRALKESNRLAPAKLEQGHYANLLRLCIEQRHAVGAALQVSG